MDKNVEFLNYIYQNTQMGLKAIQDVDSANKNPEVKQYLDQQYKEYEKMNQEADQKIKERGGEEKELGKVKDFISYVNIHLNLLADSTPQHVAEMMVKGSNMGVIDITKNLSKYQDCDSDVIKLGERLLKTEQNNEKSWQNLLLMV